MRIVSFNVQNLRLRKVCGRPRLDGARDADVPGDAAAAARALDHADRRLTAAVIARSGADVVCLQEVFDRATLDHFHDEYLLATGVAPWPHRVCLPGNDGHGRDLALMSRRPLDEVVSHAALRPADLGLALPAGQNPQTPLFRRDCLMVRIGVLVLYLCHFKAPYPDPAAAWDVRRMEAQAVRRLIERRFAPAPEAGLWLILGDLNEPASEPGGARAIAPLIGDFSADLLERLPQEERWSYHLPDEQVYSRPDVLLASPALARRWPDACPQILREGMGGEAERHRGARLPGVGRHRPHASDHAALVVDFAGL
jgi:endonuclease/exonuclease/phosphatase family metal-dependent hydrolase